MPDRFAAGLSQGGSQSRFHMDAFGVLSWTDQFASMASGARYAAMIDRIASTSTITRTHNIIDWKFAYYCIYSAYLNPNAYFHMMGYIAPDNPSIENPYLPCIVETNNDSDVYVMASHRLSNVTITVTATTFAFDTKLDNNSRYDGVFIFIY